MTVPMPRESLGESAPTRPTDPVVSDDRFMENVAEAIENGYARCCVFCGVGVYDESDMHERACPEYSESGR